MLIFIHHMGTWQQRFVSLTLSGSLNGAVAPSTRYKIVEYCNSEKQFKTLMASLMGGLGGPRSQ